MKQLRWYRRWRALSRRKVGVTRTLPVALGCVGLGVRDCAGLRCVLTGRLARESDSLDRRSKVSQSVRRQDPLEPWTNVPAYEALKQAAGPRHGTTWWRSVS